MDKFRDDAILAYDQGTRAYAKDTGSVFQKADGTQVSVRVWGLWHALRAYQDAERKKGVPITMYIADWQNRDYFQNEGQLLVFHLDKEDRPHIIARGKIDPIGRFTNFRWRAGYPKGGQNG